MKFSMECNVVSNTLLDGEIPILHNGRTYVFSPNEQGFLSKIKIIAPVKDPSKFYSVITNALHPEPTLNIQLNRDSELYDSVHKEFQELESILALKYDLQGIDWAYPRYDLIFETDEEREKAELFGFGEQKPGIGPPMKADGAGLLEIVQHKENMEPLIAPLSFYREAINDLRAFKHINVFFNCYFIIEGLFGNGKTKNTHVAQEFKKSIDFVQLVKDVVEPLKMRKPHYYSKIEETLRSKGKTLQIDAIIDLIVSTRGDLHHFQNNPSRPQGTPFRHTEYEAIAFLTRGIAIGAIFFRLGQINEALRRQGKLPKRENEGSG
jgi:hypothetical protein